MVVLRIIITALKCQYRNTMFISDFLKRKETCFNIDVSIQQAYPLIEENKHTILRLTCKPIWGLNNPEVVIADPFLFVHKDILYLFYEDVLYKKGKGVIKMISTKDLMHWTTPINITSEPDTHFSFPFIFEDNGSIYMLPETGSDYNIRLYKADNDSLTSFSPYKIIYKEKRTIKDIEFVCADNVIHKKNGIYYLLSSYKTKESYFLELYTSTSLEGPYKTHPDNPIVSSNKYGRCAGSLLEKDGHLYRFAQDCERSYGEQIHLLEIDKLTPTEYKEHVLKENILHKNQKFYQKGGHQVNFVRFNEQIVVATDAKDEGYFYLERVRLIFLKTIKRIIRQLK